MKLQEHYVLPSPATVDAAYNIAWDFLSRSGAVTDVYQARLLVCKAVLDLSGRGIDNKIRLANLAIAAVERELAARGKDALE